MQTVTVLIGESLDIPLAGLRTILANTRTIDVVAVATTSRELVRECKARHPRVCVLSSNLRGLRLQVLMKSLKTEHNSLRTLLISSASSPLELDLALRAGVDGYLQTTASKDLLRRAVERVARGETVFDKTTSQRIHLRYIERLRERSNRESGQTITRREAEILNYIIEGYTSREIANELFISPRTVETHRFNLLRKLKIRNTPALIRFVLEEGDPDLTRVT